MVLTLKMISAAVCYHDGLLPAQVCSAFNPMPYHKTHCKCCKCSNDDCSGQCLQQQLHQQAKNWRQSYLHG